MYARMLPLLLKQAAYPADFTSWDECVALDEEVFSRFRYVLSRPNPLHSASHVHASCIHSIRSRISMHATMV